MYELKFADIGEGVHEGEILEWHVNTGDRVNAEQLLLEVNTEKVNVEITAPVKGIIKSINFAEGDIVKVGDILLIIDDAKATKHIAEEKIPRSPSTTTEKDDSLFTPATPFKRIAKRQSDKKIQHSYILASPAVRHRARLEGVNLADVTGSATAGRITREDLAQYLANSQQPVLQSETRIPLNGMRRTIAHTMRKSIDTAAHYTYFEEVDLTALQQLREKLKPLMEEKGIKIGYPALFMKFMIPALKKFPLMNSYLDEKQQEIVLRDYFNIGISVDTAEGLVVPVVKNVEQKSLWQIAEEINILAAKAKAGKLALADISGGTISITSIGNIGGMLATPIIKPPEVAILGLMQAKLRPVVIEKNGVPEIAIRYVMYLSLSLDHRIVDGAVGARFMADLIRYIEDPLLVWLEE